MKQSEAKKLWCPQSRVSLYHRSTEANRMVRYGSGLDAEDFVAFEAATRCLGAGCMLWRWEASTALTDIGRVERGGYCGLGGAPT